MSSIAPNHSASGVRATPGPLSDGRGVHMQVSQRYLWYAYLLQLRMHAIRMRHGIHI